jgi:hypothetical protein
VDLAVSSFIAQAFASTLGTWDPDATRSIAGTSPPDAVGGTAHWLLFGDAHTLWARWFLEGLADPQQYVDGRRQYPHLLTQVREAVSTLAVATPADEQREMARGLADLLWREVERRTLVRRVPADRELRLLLWDLYPRCWVCGAAFPEWARAAFLGEELNSDPAGLPFVDFYKPRGVRPMDLRIEVEHVVPRAGGGLNDPGNLRLSCGWCNRAKGARTVLYDAEGSPRVFRHPTLGLVATPQPFWVVRLLALRPRCEHPSGCAARVTDQELTVATRLTGGAPNPANLIVVCSEHDPLADNRLVGARYFPAR